MNLEPRQVRKEPITIPRPGTDSDSVTSDGGGAGGMSAPGLHHTPEGGMVAVGFQGMLALAAAAGAVSTVPADGDAQ